MKIPSQHTALQLELLVLTYIKALRTGHFSLYVDCLIKLAPWLFSLDHIKYARWLPVHIRDMVNLNKAHPQTASEFNTGNFIVLKTRRVFSSMAIDQAHQQNNAAVKSHGGVVGLTPNPEALQTLRHSDAGWWVGQKWQGWQLNLKQPFMECTRWVLVVCLWWRVSVAVMFAQHVKGLVEVMEAMGLPISGGERRPTASGHKRHHWLNCGTFSFPGWGDRAATVWILHNWSATGQISNYFRA